MAGNPDKLKVQPDDDSRPAYCNIFPSDWLGGCATLPPMAEWTYLQISMHNMDKGEPVKEIDLPLVLVRHGGDWQADLDLLIRLSKVIKAASGSVFVKRALIEYNRSNDALQKKKNAGKKGAEKRWKNKGKDSTAIKKGCDNNGNQEPRAKNQEPRAKTVSKDTGENGDLIFSVDPEIWSEFVEHREKIKKPMSERTEKRILKDLELWQGKGHDPGAILTRSIDNGWTGIFEPKGAGNGNGNNNGGRGLLDACTE